MLPSEASRQEAVGHHRHLEAAGVPGGEDHPLWGRVEEADADQREL